MMESLNLLSLLKTENGENDSPNYRKRFICLLLILIFLISLLNLLYGLLKKIDDSHFDTIMSKLLNDSVPENA